MSDLSASPAEAPQGERPTLVWDAPVRVFHWLMVLCFAGAYLTAETERWRLVHVTLGYTMAGLVGFRLVWGLAGTRYARFASFVRGPRAVARYLGSLVKGQPEHHVGHNPAGALAILVMLGLTLVITSAGWAIFNDLGGEWLEEAHELAANLMLTVVGVHVAAVVLSSKLHGENLVAAMFHGRKKASPTEGARSPWRTVAALMLASVLGFWAWQWQNAPTPSDQAASLSTPGEQKPQADDDDD